MSGDASLEGRSTRGSTDGSVDPAEEEMVAATTGVARKGGAGFVFPGIRIAPAAGWFTS
jgi:hypothetical protein